MPAARAHRPAVLSIGGLYEEVDGALTQAFPRNRHLWVRGEIAHLSDHRSGHLYLNLVDPDEDGGRRRARARGACPPSTSSAGAARGRRCGTGWPRRASSWPRGWSSSCAGTLDLYRPKGEISLILAEVDVTALLGRLAAQRAQLLRTLEAEGLLARNAGPRRCRRSPLHVGLIASPGTEGYNDFLGQLTGSGFGFRVSVVKVAVQGAGAAAVHRPGAHRARPRATVTSIAVVRGGGARADLAAFETEVVARAVAEATKPVFTGIGHTGDETVADIVAAGPASRPPSAGTRSCWRPGGGGRTHVAAPADGAGPPGPDLPGRRRGARRPGAGVASPRRRGTSSDVHGERLGAKASPRRAARRPGWRSSEATVSAPMPPGSGRSAWVTSVAMDERVAARGAGCSPPTTWTGSSSGATP